jgi:hypothetical protein
MVPSRKFSPHCPVGPNPTALIAQDWVAPAPAGSDLRLLRPSVGTKNSLELEDFHANQASKSG